MPTSARSVHLKYFDEQTIAVITLDDPEHGNAMSLEMGDAFSQAIRDIQRDATARAVVIRGAGRHFSIGGHRDMLIKLGSGSMDERQLREFMLAFYNHWLPMVDLEIPVISAMHGGCIGVAPVFACALDIALADETLNLQITFAGLGFYPGMGLPYLLTRKMGKQRTGLLMMANLAISGREAERIGLVDRCVVAETVFDEALKIVRDIAASEPGTVRKLKRYLGLDRRELQAELEHNPTQQAKDFQTEEYCRRVVHYLPNYYE